MMRPLSFIDFSNNLFLNLTPCCFFVNLVAILDSMEDYPKDISKLKIRLAAVEHEVSAKRAKSELRDIGKDAKKIFGDHASIVSAGISNKAYSRLATLENYPDKRERAWRDAKNICLRALKVDDDPDIIISFAETVVSIFHDNNSAKTGIDIRKEIAGAIAHCREKYSDQLSERYRVLLLTQISSLLRCRAQIDRAGIRRKSLEEAIRSADRALEINELSVLALLSKGQASWSAARYAPDDQIYFSEMRSAEKTLRKAIYNGNPLALLVLSRFYRQTYRSSQSIDVFKTYLEKEESIRERLSNATVLAESVIMLSYQVDDVRDIFDEITFAKSLVSEAIDAGFEDARFFTCQAMLHGIEGDLIGAETVLKQLRRNMRTSWTEAMQQAIELIDKSDFQELSTAFCLGVDDSSMWNSLGTFATRFLDDITLSNRMYTTGLSLNPRNPVILNNLARLYTSLGDEASLSEAQTFATRAINCADRCFIWPRGVLSHIRELRGQIGTKQPVIADDSMSEFTNRIEKFSSLRERFLQLVSLDRTLSQSRGYLFEKLIQSLLSFSFGIEVIGSHKVQGRQVDAGFLWDGSFCRVETKWESAKTSSPAFDSFERKLNLTAESRGLFISMAGFHDIAVERANEIARERLLVLVDGDELRQIFDGHIHIDQLLDYKMSQVRMFGNAYGKLSTNLISEPIASQTA